MNSARAPLKPVKAASASGSQLTGNSLPEADGAVGFWPTLSAALRCATGPAGRRRVNLSCAWRPQTGPKYQFVASARARWDGRGRALSAQLARHVGRHQRRLMARLSDKRAARGGKIIAARKLAG